LIYCAAVGKQVCSHFFFQLLYFQLQDNGGLGPALQVRMCVPSLPFLKDKVLLVIGLSPAILPTIERQTCEIWYFLNKFDPVDLAT